MLPHVGLGLGSALWLGLGWLRFGLVMVFMQCGAKTEVTPILMQNKIITYTLRLSLTLTLTSNHNVNLNAITIQ